MSGREVNGRFARGCKGGPGRPPRRKEADYLRALGNVVSPQDWEAVCKKALADAKAGDSRARAWPAQYLMPDDCGLGQLEAEHGLTANVLENLRAAVAAARNESPHQHDD